MTEFTPLQALIGGMLIGLSAAGLMLFHGRIAGVSGILGAALVGRDDRSWRWAFLVGLPLGAAVTAALQGGVQIDVPDSLPVLVAGGLLVGIGTQVGSGCTSGHGVCGLARWSGRSLTATAIFMVTAAVVVFLVRLLGMGS